MKKLLLAILVVIAVGKISAQNEYLQNNPEWVVMHINGINYPCISDDSMHYYLNGDSVISSLIYKQLWKCGHVYYSWQSPNPNPGCGGQMSYCDTIPTGFVRSQGMQMYYIPLGDTAEQLLYDFNLSVGDPIPVTFTYCCPQIGDTVFSIDSIYTPYGYRLRYRINNSWGNYLVEGIGSNFGFIEPYGVLLDHAFRLECYALNDTSWFPSQGPACDVITTIPVQNQQDISLQLVPNPAREFVDISANGLIVELITVYDVFGRVVIQESVESKIFVGDLPAGIYTCVVTSGEIQISRKLIVE